MSKSPQAKLRLQDPLDMVDEELAKSPLGKALAIAATPVVRVVAMPTPVPQSSPSSHPTNISAPLLQGDQRPPAFELKKERPAHRIMLELTAKGHNVKEIAELTGYTTAAVSSILRQRHSQQTMVDEIQRIHGVVDEFVEIINRNIVKSAQLYEDILDDPKASRAEKMEVAERFINRKFGKAAQPIVHSNVDPNELSDEELGKMLPKQNTPGHQN